MIELQIGKQYASPEAAHPCAQRRLADHRPRRVRRHHRNVRFRQIDTHERPRPSRPANERPLHIRGTGGLPTLRVRACPLSKQEDRLRLPGVPSPGRTTALENVELPLVYSDRESTEGLGNARSTRWGWPTGCRINRANCPAANSSASPSPAPSSTSPISSSPTSRRATSIPNRRAKCSASCNAQCRGPNDRARNARPGRGGVGATSRASGSGTRGAGCTGSA